MEKPTFLDRVLRRKPKTEEAEWQNFDMTGDTPEYHVVMPQWAYHPTQGFVRQMRSGEIFNPNEMRLLGSSPSAWACKKQIGDSVIGAPWHILPVDPDHPNKEMMKEITYFLQKGRRSTAKSLQYVSEPFNHVIFATVMDILDLDAGVIIKVFGRMAKNRLLQIQSRDGATILKQCDIYGILEKFWQYDIRSTNLDPVPLDPREVVYTMLNPKSNSPYGESPLETIRMVIKSLVKGVAAKELIHRKGGIPSGIMSLKDMNKVDFDAFKKWWAQKQRSKVYKTAMVNVDMKWVPLITSFRDLEFLETQRWFTELVYRTFKVPHYGLGTGKGEVKGALEEQRKAYIKETIYPILMKLEQQINTFIIPHFYKEGEEPDCNFHYPILDVIDEAQAFELWSKKFEWGAATINQYLKQQGKDPLPWGDFNPSIIKNIMPTAQSWFYGAIDTASLNKISGLSVPKIAELLREKTPVAKVPPTTPAEE